jgi:rare lipoprotein A (peptidoglycan hydrolase)
MMQRRFMVALWGLLVLLTTPMAQAGETIDSPARQAFRAAGQDQVSTETDATSGTVIDSPARRAFRNRKSTSRTASKRTAEPGESPVVQHYEVDPAFAQKGSASWYGPGFHGRTTANGEHFDQNALTAAHKTLPFNTRLKVTNTVNNRSVIVRINDRGPYTGGRIIDLSKGAAAKIGIIGQGVGRVRLEKVNP